jgi:hypothetical protein
MLSNLSTFLSEDCANVHLQTLIAGDPVSSNIVRLNHRSVSAREEQIFEEVVEKRAWNSSQRVALYGTLKQQFSLIQGPPGTGKTNTAAAVVEVHHMAGKAVAVTAPSNNAVDEVSVRLVQHGVALVRAGGWSRISKKHLSVLQPYSLDFISERELQGYSEGGKAWKRERGKILARELSKQSVVVAGTFEGVGIGPTLTSKPRGCGPVRAICGCIAFLFSVSVESDEWLCVPRV